MVFLLQNLHQFFTKIIRDRVDGYNVLLKTINDGLNRNTSHYFYGSDDLVLKKLIVKLKDEFPTINIVGSFSPPVGTT